jgi:dynactin complex subunit
VVGVELVRANGLGDGTLQGYKYFECEKGYGSLMHPKHIATSRHHDAARVIQAGLRGMRARRNSKSLLDERAKKEQP